jgi:hypothetical protein
LREERRLRVCHLSFIYQPFAKCVTLGQVNQRIRIRIENRITKILQRVT